MTVKKFLLNLLLMAFVVLLILGGTMLWLRFYTSHGQKLELPNYEGKHIKEASIDADDRSFQIVIKDSTHRVGIPGGLILAQNPKPGSLVKENRKIYVDVAKYNADVIALADMRPLYGHEYDNKKKELASMFINSVIKSRRYDKGEPNHILEVWYEGEKIDGQSGKKPGVEIKVGSTLEFIVSGVEGGKTALQDYTCNLLKEAEFMIGNSRFKVGNIEKLGAITDMSNAYIVAQNPSFEEDLELSFGTPIDLTIQQAKPKECN